eukprot:scaffold193053_cov31-Prasinocladus_malaysianus.AAC.1
MLFSLREHGWLICLLMCKRYVRTILNKPGVVFQLPTAGSRPTSKQGERIASRGQRLHAEADHQQAAIGQWTPPWRPSVKDLHAAITTNAAPKRAEVAGEGQANLQRDPMQADSETPLPSTSSKNQEEKDSNIICDVVALTTMAMMPVVMKKPTATSIQERQQHQKFTRKLLTSNALTTSPG